jgi:hypothetical protein
MRSVRVQHWGRERPLCPAMAPCAFDQAKVTQSYQIGSFRLDEPFLGSDELCDWIVTGRRHGGGYRHQIIHRRQTKVCNEIYKRGSCLSGEGATGRLLAPPNVVFCNGLRLPMTASAGQGPYNIRCNTSDFPRKQTSLSARFRLFFCYPQDHRRLTMPRVTRCHVDLIVE